MAALPDDLWGLILEIGVQTRRLNYKDLCRLSMSSRHLHRLSNQDSVWSTLLLYDFSSSSSSKLNYKIRFEKDRDRRMSAHRRALWRKESQMMEHWRKLQDLKAKILQETEKMKVTVSDLLNLRKARQASVALKVWQPEVIRGMQKQFIEQCSVPLETRACSLEMELKDSKIRLSIYENRYKLEKERFDLAKEDYSSMMYNPFADLKFMGVYETACSELLKRFKQSDERTSLGSAATLVRIGKTESDEQHPL